MSSVIKINEKANHPQPIITTSGDGIPGLDIVEYGDYAFVIQSIQARLEGQYRARFQLYVQEDYGQDLWDQLERDIQADNPEVERLCAVFDTVEARTFTFGDAMEGEGPRMFPSLRNNVFVYPRFRVAMARVPMFRQHGISCEDFIWAESDAGLAEFLTDMSRRQRQYDREQVTVFKDTRDGLDRERESLTRGVKRDEVVMNEGVKTEIYRSIDEFFAQDRHFFQTYGLPYKRGILLYGKPGNGKTTLVKSIAGSVDAPVAYWHITEYTTSDSIQEVFEAAVRMAPMVLVIEDIDSMPESARSYFLNTLDGATSKEGIFLIGTTNYPEKIDPALMNRAGRFDRAYEIKLPDEEQRRSYLLLKRLHELLDDEAVAVAARATEGFTFAQLGELYVSAALRKHYEHTVDVEQLVREMNTELGKGRTQLWHSDQKSSRVGFTTG
ncbi:AAA family ATPase [Paenibacillus oleatilyticus]|uniref:AAA family ATPase n=1 Tax=Paenibacillus oleatilyticus TaxID=2594886 RepID=A0ABV4V416_9BACL